MNSPLWHYPRFIHANAPQDPEGSGLNSSQDASRAAFRKETAEQLHGLAASLESNPDALLQFTQALAGEKIQAWNEEGVDTKKVAQKLENALSDIRASDAKFKAPEGFMTLVEGLKAKSGSSEHKKALKSLQAFTDVIDQHRGETLKTQEGLKEVKGDVVIQKVEGFVKTIGDRLGRGSGTEKVVLLGTLAASLYFIFNNDTIGKIAKWGGGIFVLDQFIGLATGKTGHEHLGLLTANGELPKEMQYALEKSGLKDPRQAIGLAKLSGKKVDSLYGAYSGSQNHKIRAAAFGLHDKEMTDEELYTFMDTLVTSAGGRNEFRKKYFEKDMTLLDVILATSGSDVLNEIGKHYPKESQKMCSELRTLFSDRREFQVDGIITKLGGFPVPTPRGNPDSSSKNRFYTFTFDGREVTLNLNDDKSSLSKKLDQIESLVGLDISKKVQGSGFIKGHTPELRGEQWMIPGVEVKPGVKKDIYLKSISDVAFDYYIDGEKLSGTEFGIVNAYEKFEGAQKIREKIPFLRGIPLEVQKVSVDTAGVPQYECSFGGAPLHVSILPDGRTAIPDAEAEALLKNSSFLRAKEQWFDEQISSSDFASLKNITSELNEDWLTLKAEAPYFFNPSGSVGENLWKAGFDAKKATLRDAYTASISHVSGPHVLQLALAAEESCLADIRFASQRLYKSLDDHIVQDEDVSANDFDAYYSQLLLVGVSSVEAKSNIERVSKRFMKSVNHEGIDGSDLAGLANWSNTYKKIVEKYLSVMAPALRKPNWDDKDRQFAKVVETKMFDGISRFTRKSSGILWTDGHESLNLENIGDLDIPEYYAFRAGETVQTGNAQSEVLYNGQTAPVLNMRILDGNVLLVTQDMLHPGPQNRPDRLSNVGVATLMRSVVTNAFSNALLKTDGTRESLSKMNEVKNSFVDSYDADFKNIFYVNGTPTVAGPHSFPDQVTFLRGYQTRVTLQFQHMVQALGGKQ